MYKFDIAKHLCSKVLVVCGVSLNHTGMWPRMYMSLFRGSITLRGTMTWSSSLRPPILLACWLY